MEEWKSGRVEEWKKNVIFERETWNVSLVRCFFSCNVLVLFAPMNLIKNYYYAGTRPVSWQYIIILLDLFSKLM